MAGELHMLPTPLPPVVEQSMLDDQVLKLQATENSVVLQLTRNKICQLMEDNEVLTQVYRRNVLLWERASDANTLCRNWLFGSCPPSVRKVLSACWSPRVFPEGSYVIADDNGLGDYCVILLSGTVLIKRRQAGSEKIQLERAEDGCVLNELTLLGAADEHAEAFGDMLYVGQNSNTACMRCRCRMLHLVST